MREVLYPESSRCPPKIQWFPQGGINLLTVDESKGLPVLPFPSYHGLLSRAPSRLSPELQRSVNANAVAEAR